MALFSTDTSSRCVDINKGVALLTSALLQGDATTCCLCQEIVKMDVQKVITLIKSQPIQYDWRHKNYPSSKEKPEYGKLLQLQ